MKKLYCDVCSECNENSYVKTYFYNSSFLTPEYPKGYIPIYDHMGIYNPSSIELCNNCATKIANNFKNFVKTEIGEDKSK